MAKFPPINQATDIPNATLGGESKSIDTSSGFEKLGAGLVTFGEAMQKRAEQDDISNQDVKLEQYATQKTKEWQDAIANPDLSDKEFGNKFLTSFNEGLSKIGEETSTRSGSLYYTRRAAEMQRQMALSVAHGEAELAGVRAVTSLKTSHSLRTARVYTDPTQLDSAVNDFKMNLESLVQTKSLSRENALKIESQYVPELGKNAALGWAKIDPEQTKIDLAAGKFDAYLSGDEKRYVEAHADQEIRARKIEEEALRKQQERALKDEQRAVQNKFFDKIEAGTLTIKEIQNSILDPVGMGSKEHYAEFLRSSLTSAKAQTNPVFQSLWRRIHLPDNHPEKITDDNYLDSFVSQIGVSNVKLLRKEIQGQGTQEGATRSILMKGLEAEARAKLTKGFGIPDPEGQRNYQAYMAFMLDTYHKQRAAGKSDQELLDAKSPDYLGKYITNFKPSLDEVTDSISKQFEPVAPVPPPQPAPTVPIKDRIKQLQGGK